MGEKGKEADKETPINLTTTTQPLFIYCPALVSVGKKCVTMDIGKRRRSRKRVVMGAREENGKRLRNVRNMGT